MKKLTFSPVWNLVCGFAKTPAQLIVFRFLAGLGGSAPLAVSYSVSVPFCARSSTDIQTRSVLGPSVTYGGQKNVDMP